MNQDAEIAHLIDLMPASGRMYCKLQSRSEQPQVIAADLPLPWSKSRPIRINFDLWADLTRPQRDLLLLRTVCWLNTARWLKFDLSRGVLAAGLVGSLVELVQGDVVGVVTGTSLMGWAGWRIWQDSRSSQQEMQADEAAVSFAQQRGYGEQDAARHLLGAIEAVAKIENRFGLDFVELLRCQNLRAIAGLSSVNIPPDFRNLR
ncbi:DUF3318 domain-containing protein [Leptolyngbya sp. AN02str]|uniref:DUF3318 domain-containing protein n=1 Tax=Leptolyngbya sp. AN02str TaxID=3423363 RepID=UPI003D3192D5